MTKMASQITSLTVVYSTVYSDADQIKHQSSASLAFVWGIHRDRWIPRTKGQLRGKCGHFMTSSCVTESDVGLCTLLALCLMATKVSCATRHRSDETDRDLWHINYPTDTQPVTRYVPEKSATCFLFLSDRFAFLQWQRFTWCEAK